MRRPKSQYQGSAVRAEEFSGASDITAENYSDRAVSFLQARGIDGFVIRSAQGSHGSIMTGRPPTSPQWHAWLSYFSDKKIKSAFLLSHGMATVPTEWPEDFDLAAPTSDRFWQPSPVPPAASRDFSPALSALFGKLKRSI